MLAQCWHNVGTIIPDLDTLELVVLMLLMLATLVYGCFNVGTTISDLDTPELVALMLLMLAKLLYSCFNVGTTISDLDTLELVFNAVNAGNFDVWLFYRWHNHTKFGYPHPLPWVACEKKLDTLKLVVLMLLMLYKVVLKTNKKFSFESFFFKFSGFDFVINILSGLLGGFLHTYYFFYTNLLLVWFLLLKY